jgi:4'-phosphopantetheinyl transferase
MPLHLPKLLLTTRIPPESDDWREASATSPPALVQDATHVWQFRLDAPLQDVMEMERVLSKDERERAKRFRFDRHRTRYVVGRATIRALLSGYVRSDPASLLFDYNEFGKPHLPDGPDFNMSHSEGLALLAVSATGPVGVDVECLGREMEFESIARQYFPPAEAAAVLNAIHTERPTAFFTAWTRREAWLKAIGVGLSGLDRSDSAYADRCRVVTFTPAEGFVAALAIDAGGGGGPAPCPPSR